MHRPQMILFDYGETLAFERPYDNLAAARAILDSARTAPRGLTVEEVAAVGAEAFRRTQAARDIGWEMHNHQLLRYQLARLGIEPDISLRELERRIHDAAAPGWAADNAANMLARLADRGLRTGVISNILLSGEALKARLDDLFPDNRFEMVVASSEYAFRKPAPELFETALRMANLEPGEAWYCGNSVRFDVLGARSAGIFPVWYCPDRQEPAPDCQHARIADWLELPELVDTSSET